MSNDYATSLLVGQHHAELREEAAQARLARLARQGRRRHPRWWERLTRSHSQVPARTAPAPAAAVSGRAAQRPTATVAAGNSPC